MTKAFTKLEDLIVREPDNSAPDPNGLYPNSKLDFKSTFDKVLEFRKGEGRDIDILNELFSDCQETYPSTRDRDHSSKTKYDNMSPETRVFEATGLYLNGKIGYDLAISAPICTSCWNDIGCPHLCSECQWFAYERLQEQKREHEERQKENEDVD